MSFTEFESDILEILNEEDLSTGLVRRKIHATLRKIESLWNFPYMFKQQVVTVPSGNAPLVIPDTEWKEIKKVGLWSTDAIDTTLTSHGGGSTGFIGFLQKITEEDLKKDHFDTLNVTTSWGEPLMWQMQDTAFEYTQVFGETRTKSYKTRIQLYPPPEASYRLTVVGYQYSRPYNDVLEETDGEPYVGDDHWILHYGRDLLEAWTILNLTPAVQDASLAAFYKDLVADAQETLLKSEANADWEGLDETVEYVGESDI
jgi:hypothetical protein